MTVQEKILPEAESTTHTNSSKDQQALRSLLDNLPTLPEVATRMLSLNPDSDNYYEEILSLSSQDPFIAVRIIQLANSAANAGRSQITSIQQAIARVGTNQVKTLATSIALAKAFKPTTEEQRNLWLHAILTGCFGKQLARLNRLDAEQAYLTGLLHDIGRIILLKYQITKETDEHSGSIYGYNHNELAVEACKMWGIPESIYLDIGFMQSWPQIPSYAKSAEKYRTGFLLKLASELSLMAINNSDTLEVEEAVQTLAGAIAEDYKDTGLFFTTAWVANHATELLSEAREVRSTLTN